MSLFFRAKSQGDLIILCVITLLLFLVVDVSHSVLLHTIFALPVIFFFPGYALLSALYPRNTGMRGMERLLLSFGLSLAIVPIVCLIMNYVVNLTLYPTLTVLTLFILVMSLIAWWRRRRLFREEIFTLPSLRNIQLDRIIQNYRFILWLSLIALTIIILLFLVHLALDTPTFQSLDIFTSQPLFSSLFLVWMAVLLFLLFVKREAKDWENLALVCIFALVFIDFWNIITPFGYSADSFGHLSMVRYLQEGGKIPELSLGYYQFPGFHLYANFLAQTTGLDLFDVAYIIRIYENIVFAALLYRVNANTLKNSYLAPAAVMLTIMTMQAHHFAFIPHLFAFILLLTFLILLTRNEREVLVRTRDRLLVIILIVATTISSFWHSMLFFFILLGLYLVQKLGGEKPVEVTILLLVLAVLLGWEVYQAVTVFGSLVELLPTVYQNIVTGDMFSTSGRAAAAILGGGDPLWAVATKYFWLMTITGLGTLLWFVQLVRVRKLSYLEKMEVGGVLGTILFFTVVTVSSTMGYYASRYQEFVRIFTPAIIMRFGPALGQRWEGSRFSLSNLWRKASTIFLIILLFVVSFPTFLLEGRGVAGQASYSQDIAAGEFLESRYGKGEGLTVFSNFTYAAGIRFYYLPDAEGKGPREPSVMEDGSVLWEDVYDLIEEFVSPGGNRVFLYSERAANYSWFNVKPDDPRWQEIKKELADFVGEENIWSNNYYSIYFPP
ncbi:DUF1616 domain-containing protein [Chloroflexota bacterium]